MPTTYSKRLPKRTQVKFIPIFSIFMSCILVSVGCSPFDGYIALDLGPGLMQPTFRMYGDPYFQERVGRILGITVSKRLRSSEEQKRWELDSPWNNSQTVWDLDYKPADGLMDGLLRRLLRSSRPVPRLTYGEVPPGYEEKVKAEPLEPDQPYFIEIFGYRGMAAFHGTLEFIIRLDGTGIPNRLEYRLPDDIFENARRSLKLN